jgi:glycerophosphoryl diester phosphodiesterase
MQIASHRGLGTPFQENSLAAFAAAVAAGASVLETDLRTTQDGQVVLIHNKTHPGVKHDKFIINQTSYAVLQTAVQQAGVTLDRFDALFCQFPQQELILDIKWRGGSETLHALHRWARQENLMQQLQQRALFLLWLPEHLSLCRELFPAARLVANRSHCLRLCLYAMLAPVRASDFAILSIPGALFRLPRLAARVVRHMQADGVRLQAYLPTQAREVQCARALGVQLVMADRAAIWSAAQSTST